MPKLAGLAPLDIYSVYMPASWALQKSFLPHDLYSRELGGRSLGGPRCACCLVFFEILLFLKTNLPHVADSSSRTHLLQQLINRCSAAISACADSSFTFNVTFNLLIHHLEDGSHLHLHAPHLQLQRYLQLALNESVFNTWIL